MTSSYLNLLPPALWDVPATPDAGVTLGDLLRIVEKVLTGVPDDAVLRHGDHTHDAIGDQIGRVARVFDAWTTPPEFLGWLAPRLALDVPTLRDQPLWNEYQRRAAVDRIAAV